MIHITIYQGADEALRGFFITGHAGYAHEGEPDILCASVSMLVINTMNAIETFTGDTFCQDVQEDGAVIRFQITGKPSRESELLLRTMVLGLEMLEDDENYKDFIDIIFEEVPQP